MNLNFKEFLIEMETTTNEKEQIRTIIRKLIEGDKSFFTSHEISVGDKGQYWILNYTPGGRTEYNRLVRGMVVAKPNAEFNNDPLKLIKSFPFIRFYNHGEKESDPINFNNSEMLEKMDGTMVGLFFPHGNVNQPEFHTRKMLSTHKDDFSRKITSFQGVEFSFLPTIKKYVDSLKFSEQDVAYTYVFEFLHQASQVLTKYKPNQYGLYLLGARNLETHRELTEDELDIASKRIGAFRPRRFDAVSDHSEIERMFDLARLNTPDFEGFIFRDRETGKRIKVKDPRYVEKHHAIDQSGYKNLVPLILKGETEEIVAYFPHTKERINKIIAAYEEYLNKVLEKVKKWRSTGLTGRDLSVAIFGENPKSKWELRLAKNRGEKPTERKTAEPDEFIRNMIMKYHDIENNDLLKNKIENDIREVALGKGTNNGDPKRFIDLIGLNTDEDQTQTQQPTDVSEL